MSLRKLYAPALLFSLTLLFAPCVTAQTDDARAQAAADIESLRAQIKAKESGRRSRPRRKTGGRTPSSCAAGDGHRQTSAAREVGRQTHDARRRRVLLLLAAHARIRARQRHRVAGGFSLRRLRGRELRLHGEPRRHAARNGLVRHRSTALRLHVPGPHARSGRARRVPLCRRQGQARGRACLTGAGCPRPWAARTSCAPSATTTRTCSSPSAFCGRTRTAASCCFGRC